MCCCFCAVCVGFIRVDSESEPEDMVLLTWTFDRSPEGTTGSASVGRGGMEQPSVKESVKASHWHLWRSVSRAISTIMADSGKEADVPVGAAGTRL